MLLDSFLVKIGVDADTEKLNKFKDGIKEVSETVGKMSVAIGGFVGGLTAVVQKSLEGLDEIGQLSNVTGESVEQIKLLETIAETTGSSIQATHSSIEGLSKTIGEAVNGIGLGARAFENYGLSAKKSNGDVKSATELMDELRQKMRGMSEQSQIAMLSKLGIDKSMIQVLRLTNEEMAKAQENAKKLTLGTGTNANAKESMALQDSLTEFGQMIKAVGEYISLNLSPTIREITDLFKKWFIVNNESVKKSLKSIATVLGNMIRFIGGMAKAIDHIISSSIGWENAIKGLIIVASALSVAFAPVSLTVLAIVGALGTLVLLYEDFLTFCEGGDSVLAKMWKPLLKIVKALTPLFKTFHKLFEKNIKGLVDSAKTIVGGIIDVFTGVFQVIASLIDGDINGIKDGLKTFVSGLTTIFSGVTDFIFTPFNNAFNSIKNSETLKNIETKFNNWIDNVKKAFQTAKDFITTPFENGFKALKKMVNKYLDPIKKKINDVLSVIGLGDDEKKDTKANNSSDKEETGGGLGGVLDGVVGGITGAVSLAKKGLNAVGGVELFKAPEVANATAMGNIKETAYNSSKNTNVNNKNSQTITFNGIGMDEVLNKVRDEFSFNNVFTSFNTKSTNAI